VARSQIMPILIGGVVWLIVAFIIQTGSKNKTWKEYDDSFAVWVGAVCGVGVALITLVLIMPLLRRRINRAHERIDKCAATASVSCSMLSPMHAPAALCMSSCAAACRGVAMLGARQCFHLWG
jgi:L-cystine uptake protein TcyP (sodium:dicarboxylate symporter family)